MAGDSLPAEPAPPAAGPATAASPTSAHLAPATPEASADPATDAAGAVLHIPPARSLRYTLTGLSRGLRLEGVAGLDWRQDGDRYEATLWQEAAHGRRVMSSTGRLGAAGLAPRRFGDRPARGGEQAAHFEAGGQDRGGREGSENTEDIEEKRTPARLRFSGNQPDAPLAPGTQDRLSVLLQLAARVAGLGRPLRPGEAVDFPVATARALEHWRFRFEGEERLPLPGGEQPVLRLRRSPEGGYALAVEVWLAPALDYLPVRLRLTQASGDWLEQRWTPDDRD